MNLSDPMLPEQFFVKRILTENHDTFTLELSPLDKNSSFTFSPGQFNMLYMFGMGEVAISISGNPSKPLPLFHTIRAVGSITKAMQNLKKGSIIGLRGPFGTPWPIDLAIGKDLIIVVGGIGLAPLRPLIYHLISHRPLFNNIFLLYGSRTPNDQIFLNEFDLWNKFIHFLTIVDRADNSWHGNVGVVTDLLSFISFTPSNSIAFLCGPEIMMRLVSIQLLDLGILSHNIFLSLERNMSCAIGFCGHCQFASSFICKDGPVFPFSLLQKFLLIRHF